MHQSHPIRSSRQVKNRHIGLCLVDDPQQLLKDLTDSWRIHWAMRGMKRQNCDAGGQMLKSEQSIPREFLSNGRGGDFSG